MMMERGTGTGLVHINKYNLIQTSSAKCVTIRNACVCVFLLYMFLCVFASMCCGMSAWVLPVAVVTLEGLCPGVFAVVPCQFVTPGETPLTTLPGTLVGLLT